MAGEYRIQMRARLFLGLPVPAHIQYLLENALRQYAPYLASTVPASHWHITLVFLGEAEIYEEYISAIIRPLSQGFLTTISLTHVGVGQTHHQLWAYINLTTLLANVRTALWGRLHSLSGHASARDEHRTFIPHINLGRIKSPAGSVGIADYPLGKAFVATTVHLYRSELLPHSARYTIIGTIPLTSSGA